MESLCYRIAANAKSNLRHDTKIQDITFFPPAIISMAVGNIAAALALLTDVISWNGIIF